MITPEHHGDNLPGVKSSPIARSRTTAHGLTIKLFCSKYSDKKRKWGHKYERLEMILDALADSIRFMSFCIHGNGMPKQSPH